MDGLVLRCLATLKDDVCRPFGRNAIGSRKPSAVAVPSMQSWHGWLTVRPGGCIRR